MDLDFSPLDGLVKKEPPEAAIFPPIEQSRPAPEEPGLLKLQRESDEKQEKIMHEIEVYREYQRNILRSAQLRTELIKASAAGEVPLADLLLMAVECINRMIGEEGNTLYKTVSRNLVEHYGITEPPQAEYYGIRR